MTTKKPAVPVADSQNAQSDVDDDHGFPENAHYTVPPKSKRSFRILEVPEEYEWEQRKHLPKAVFPNDYAVAPCNHCSAPCCRPVIRMHVAEALEIAYTLGIPLARMVHPGAMDEDVPAHKYHTPFRLDDGDYRLRLNKTADGECINAYNPVEGLGRCGIWAMRPAVCRFYPFTVEIDQHQLKVGNQEYCPTLWLQNDDTRKRAEYDVRRMLAHSAQDKHYVTQWNTEERDERSFTAFLTWVDEVMAPGLGYDPATLVKVERRKLGKRLW